MAVSQVDKARAFQRAARRSGRLVIPNPWDIGSARMLAGLGFKALATSSAASASALGRRTASSRATRRSPTRGDRRRHGPAGFRGSRAWLRRHAGDCRRDDPSGRGVRALSAARSRTRPAIQPPAVRRRTGGRANRGRGGGRAGAALPVHAHRARAQPSVRESASLDDTIAPPAGVRTGRRARALRAGLPDLASIRAVCCAVKAPVNFMAGIKGSRSPSRTRRSGVRRISLATSLYRAAMTGLLDAARRSRSAARSSSSIAR